VTSTDQIKELHDVFARPKFDKYIDRELRDRFLLLFLQRCVLIEPTAHFTICRDAKDNRLLELAVSSQASHLITGDQELLVLDPFLGVSVVTPNAFVASATDNR
jgi:putative PIN family toxin of toxin-antitoxin system